MKKSPLLLLLILALAGVGMYHFLPQGPQTASSGGPVFSGNQTWKQSLNRKLQGFQTWKAQLPLYMQVLVYIFGIFVAIIAFIGVIIFIFMIFMILSRE